MTGQRDAGPDERAETDATTLAPLSWRRWADLPAPVRQVMASGTDAVGPPVAIDLSMAVLLAAHGLAGLSLAAAERGEVELDEAAETELRQRHFDATVAGLILRDHAARYLRAVADAGIPFVIVKGAATRVFYADPECRPFHDVDIVVAPERFSDAVTALEGAGLRRITTDLQPHEYFDRWCREGINLVDDDGLSIDVHHHVPPWFLGHTLSFERLQRESVPDRLGDLDVRCAGAVHNIIIAVLHTYNDLWKPAPSLLSWRDVIHLLHQSDPHRVLSEMLLLDRDWLLGVIVERLPNSLVPVELLRVGSRLRPPWFTAQRIRVMAWSFSSGRRGAGWGVRLPLPGALAFFAGSLVPSRPYRRLHQQGSTSLWRWWLTSLTRLGRGD